MVKFDHDFIGREALAEAIGEVASDPDTEAGTLIQRAFGGSQTISGDELMALLEAGFADSEELLNEVSQ